MHLIIYHIHSRSRRRRRRRWRTHNATDLCIYYFLLLASYFPLSLPNSVVCTRSDWCVAKSNLMQFWGVVGRNVHFVNVKSTSRSLLMSCIRACGRLWMSYWALNKRIGFWENCRFVCVCICNVFNGIPYIVSQFIVNICTVSCCYYTVLIFAHPYILCLIEFYCRCIDFILHCMQMGFCLNFGVKQNWNRIVVRIEPSLNWILTENDGNDCGDDGEDWAASVCTSLYVRNLHVFLFAPWCKSI